ncbi:hypothetical protein P175DRAFT_0493506 [Aspergillus ochraceoroseus IBT 24754]|uniref:NADH:ubiquinone oxidoreductase intermediate-associated protein 30 domain-containing protein n=1 Tax=Aspergillus ochraceoroseus IBT 24754 TaxID=1392256 RepID=A0A2T5LY59_9EURO|nr:uncharacterized protein P175DRAFT_0493506 [Aspergillus ochraceoroseus IBT 24754]PTU21226.1 hypothetical protein P175DRAFT_0493506 [Aspergillus ochraceoroseus IBT 24754]
MEDCSTHITERKVLFQGGCPWPGNWQTTHSRVVRGVSYSRLDSYLSLSEFHGWLDRRSIDSAGFAAIHTMGQDHRWDLSQYDAIEVTMSRSDDKVYTLTLEDERPIAWEGTFRPGTSGRTTSRVIRLGRLKPRKGDPYLRPLNLGDIRGFGIWIGK